MQLGWNVYVSKYARLLGKSLPKLHDEKIGALKYQLNWKQKNYLHLQRMRLRIPFFCLDGLQDVQLGQNDAAWTK
jgi:hypothetical protein